MSQEKKSGFLGKNKRVVQFAGIVGAAVVGIFVAYFLIGQSTTLVTNDQWFTYGHNYWGNKNHQNSYDGIVSFYCKNNAGEVDQSCADGLLDGRTNYVIHTTTKSGDVQMAWQASIQGTDPWGTSDVGTGAKTRNAHFDTLYADKDYQLQVQYAWFDDSVSSPSPQAANGTISANLLTDLWFRNQQGGRTNNLVVLDFALANLVNENGRWVLVENTIDQPYSPPYREWLGTDCIYHYSVVVDNNQQANEWRQTELRNIGPDIEKAFSASYADLGKAGDCPISPPDGRDSYRLLDIETGAEVFSFETGEEYYGTIKGAFSLSLLQY